MQKLLLLFILFFFCQLTNGQNKELNRIHADSASAPLIPIHHSKPAENIDIFLDMRTDFINHFEKGRDDDFSEFRVSQVAIGISGKLNDKVRFNFRNRFNKEASIQTLDLLPSNIEKANIDVTLSPRSNLLIGKIVAFFGGFEYEYNPIEVLTYNDIQDNLLSYVTGVGYKYKASENHTLGFQALNSRTMRYDDLYAGNVSEEVKEPKWPLAFVVNWNGKFWNEKFETLYSYSRFRMAKGHGTTNSFTLGHKYQLDRFKIMYDFNYDHEQLDTKGIVTNIINGENIANDVVYIENWIRAEYQFSPKLTGLVSLMTSNAYNKNLTGDNNRYSRLRTSYGYVPTLYYHPFDDLDLRFFVAYIGRHYNHSSYVKHDLGISDYYTGELRFGFIAPLWLL